MPPFEPSVTDYQPFWTWLRQDNNGHPLFELWLGLNAPDRLRPPMELAKNLLTQSWTRAVRPRKVSSTELAFLHKAAQNYQTHDDNPAEFNPEKDVVAELTRGLDIVLGRLFAQWRLTSDATERVLDLAQVRARLDTFRKRQREQLRRYEAGLFWATPDAPDGQPYIVFSSSPTSRPASTAVAAAKSTEKGKSARAASGSWTTDGATLYLTRTAGELGPIDPYVAIVGMPVSLQAPRAKGPELDVRRLQRLAGTARIEAGRGKEGFFYFVPGLGTPPKPCLLLTKARSSELATHLAEVDPLWGSWGKEGNRVTLTLLGTASVERSAGERLAKHVRSSKVFGMLAQVDVVGKGLVLPDLRSISATDKKGKPTAFAARRRTALEGSRKVAATGAGNLWFARHAGDDASLVVLYGDRGFPHDRKLLLSADPAKAAMVMEAEFQVTKSPRATQLKPAKAGGPLLDELRKRILADKLLPAPIQVVHELEDDEVDFAPLRRQIEAANRRVAGSPTGSLWFTARAADRAPLLVLHRDRVLPHVAADLLGPNPISSATPVVAKWERNLKTKVLKVTLLATAQTVALKRVLEGIGLFPERKIEFA